MGIVSAIGKLAVKAAQKVGGKTLAKGVKNVGRVAKAAPDFIFGTGSETARAAMKSTKGSIFSKIKAGTKAVVKESEAAAKNGGFFKRLGKNIVNLPKDMNAARKAGVSAAKAAGKSGFMGGLKGLGKGFVSKMPLINSLLMIGLELPNVVSATKEEGIGAGLKEAGKATLRLAGGAIGSVFGGVLGFIGGEWAVSKLTGDTYSEKKEFLEANNVTEEAINAMKAQGYTFDQIYDLAKAEVEAAEAEQKLVQTQQEISGEQPTAGQQEVAQGQEVEQGQQDGTVAQPVQGEGTEQPVAGTVQQPVTVGGQDVAQGGYSQEGISILRELGLTDEDIATLQQAGLPIEEAIKMVVNIKSQNPTATVGGATATDTTGVTQQPVVQQPITSTPAFEPFQLPYDSTFVSNPYSNDMYYKSLFGDVPSVGYAKQNDYSINPNKNNKFLGYTA